ncbi:hypothetical protein OHB04_02300 [Streptomyces sp. NBC_01775]|uniref:hypothetical protein n=1 Tax=Streptomyces sp. NBC_01775 TaxID=2975939 RepID=UPI002DD8C00D|nr:hypothetical protein [Streptomyces sp. NBC_01775]WSB74724.1 hypothetical protein OHB04_02300 [Streptomyces sp. NBC_01775]
MAEAVRYGAGGIHGLAQLLREHGEAVEWDMAHYWPGRSLLELYRGEMSWRELRVFLRYLPEGSATHRAVRPKKPDEEFWTPDRHLIATVVDAVRENTFATVKLGGDPKKTRRLKPPKPIPRPGVEQPRDAKVIRLGGRNPSKPAELAAAFRGGAATQ